MALTLNVNGETYSVDVEPETPLLWVLRDTIGLTGTKYGCGIAKCGACTVHIDGRKAFSCTTKASAAAGKEVTTIEGLSEDNSHPLQVAWIEEDVPQCGYCQSGQIMGGGGAAEPAAEPVRPRHRRGDVGQHLPLRHVRPDSQGDPPGGRDCGRMRP